MSPFVILGKADGFPFTWKSLPLTCVIKLLLWTEQRISNTPYTRRPEAVQHYGKRLGLCWARALLLQSSVYYCLDCLAIGHNHQHVTSRSPVVLFKVTLSYAVELAPHNIIYEKQNRSTFENRKTKFRLQRKVRGLNILFYYVRNIIWMGSRLIISLLQEWCCRNVANILFSILGFYKFAKHF